MKRPSTPRGMGLRPVRVPRLTALTLALYAGTSTFLASAAQAQLSVKRLTPPSNLFTFNDPDPPYISRFIPGQRFDLQAIVSPDAGQSIVAAEFRVDGELVPGTVTLTPANTGGFPANTVLATLRAYSQTTPGVHLLTFDATQSDSQRITANGNFEIVAIQQVGKKAKNVIVLIGDGMGIAHRTASC